MYIEKLLESIIEAHACWKYGFTKETISAQAYVVNLLVPDVH